MPDPISCTDSCTLPTDDMSVADTTCDAAPETQAASHDNVACYDDSFERSLDRAPDADESAPLGQAAKTAWLTAHGSVDRLVGSAFADDQARELLKGLGTTPPKEGTAISTAEYQSQLHGVRPDDAFKQFAQHAAELFGAAGIHVRPATGELHDGDRLMLEEPGVAGPPPRPPVWAPIQVNLDAQSRTIRITTLDGHPLRGTNEFHFMSDGKDGTLLRQLSRFQGSSPLTNQMGQWMGALDRQHDIWQAVHSYLANTPP